MSIHLMYNQRYPFIVLFESLCFSPSSQPSIQITLRVAWHLWAMCGVTWAAYEWLWKKNMPLFIYIHTHTECIFRCPSCCARRQFYVVGDLRWWSRCLGSDNIMTMSTGVTTYRQEGHTQAETQIVHRIRWQNWLKGSNVIPQGITALFGYKERTAGNE